MKSLDSYTVIRTNADTLLHWVPSCRAEVLDLSQGIDSLIWCGNRSAETVVYVFMCLGRRVISVWVLEPHLWCLTYGSQLGGPSRRGLKDHAVP